MTLQPMTINKIFIGIFWISLYFILALTNVSLIHMSLLWIVPVLLMFTWDTFKWTIQNKVEKIYKPVDSLCENCYTVKVS